MELVKEALGPNVLTIERTRKFSRRARLYMVSYYLLEKNGQTTTPLDVTKFQKRRKSHTDVLNVDHGFTSRIVLDIMSASNKP